MMDYEAEIVAEGVTLTGVNSLPHGRDFVLQWEARFELESFPVLRITHKIPKEKAFADEISNQKGNKNLTEVEIAGLKEEVSYFKDKIEVAKNE